MSPLAVSFGWHQLPFEELRELVRHAERRGYAAAYVDGDVSVIPSLDTPVCDLQTKRFNEEAGKLGEGVVVYTISADLPFAANRWCGAVGAKNVQCLSDHRSMSFGDAYGTHVKELRLDARAVFVVDARDRIVHAEYVKEIAEHPNYDAALAAARKAAGG